MDLNVNIPGTVEGTSVYAQVPRVWIIGYATIDLLWQAECGWGSIP